MIDFPEEIKKKCGIKDTPKHNAKQSHRPDELFKKGSPGKQTSNFPKIEFRENGQLRRELLTSEAEKWSELLYSNGNNGVTPTALRNFYNEVKALQSRIEAGGFPSNEAMVGLLKSKAAYAYARAENKRKPGFNHLKSMIEQGSDLSKSERDFKDFALFFEAVMGFFKGR